MAAPGLRYVGPATRVAGLEGKAVTIAEGASGDVAVVPLPSSAGSQYFDGGVVADFDEAYRPAGRGGIDVRHSPEIQVPFGSGVGNQGYAYENALAARLPTSTRLPPNFKTFDFFDQALGYATSAKTLDTTTASRIADPSRINSTLRRSVDAAADFEDYTLGRRKVSADQIDLREVRVAVPLETSAAQWEEMKRAIYYARERGIQLKPEVVTNSSKEH